MIEMEHDEVRFLLESTLFFKFFYTYRHRSSMCVCVHVNNFSMGGKGAEKLPRMSEKWTGGFGLGYYIKSGGLLLL